MTETLIILGDSLVDSGNTASLLAPFGLNPFVDAIYDNGGNVKASDGPVLGEHIALEIGADINNAQLFSVLSANTPSPAHIHNYAHAGARTGSDPGYSIPVLGRISIGLRDQIRQVEARSDYYLEYEDIDVLLSCGGNDLLDIMDKSKESYSITKAVIKTKKLKDDRKLANEIVKPIFKNLKSAIRKIEDIVDEIAVFGAPPIVETPEAQDWITDFSNKHQARASNFLSLASRKLQRKLENKYDDSQTIAVIDSVDLWQQLEQPGFVDTIHPSSNTSSDLAKLFSQNVPELFDSFGFS